MVLSLPMAFAHGFPCLEGDLFVDFSSIMRHSPSHGQWENAGPLSWIRIDLVKEQIDLDMVQMDLIEEDQVVLVLD